MRTPAPTLLAAALAGTTACGVSRGVRPLGEGTTAATASLGGPVADYAGAMAPLPLATVGVAHGVHDRVDVHGAAHITTVALFKLWGFEVGGGALLLDPESRAVPALMFDLNFNVFNGALGGTDPEGGLRIYPETDLRASWAWGKSDHLVYTGPSGFFQMREFTAIPSWALGNQFRWGRIDLTPEVRWIAPGSDPKSVTVDWGGVAGHGVLAFYLGTRLRFGGNAAPTSPPSPPARDQWGLPTAASHGGAR
jgi:hypothetical protein